VNKIIGVTELQRRFRSVFDEVVQRGVPHVLTRGSRPEAALVPYEEYLRFQEFQEREVLARFDRLVARMTERNDPYSEEQVEADIRVARRGKSRR